MRLCGTVTATCTVDTTTHLRRRLAERQREKAELERRVRGLRARYEEEVAPLKEQVLRLRVDRLRAAAQANMRSARLRNAYHDAQRTFEAFQERQAEASPNAVDAKTAYRRASKQCHPDRVPDTYRAEAEATFHALEGAHEVGHARAVAAIAQGLEQWGFPERVEDEAARSPGALRDAVGDLEAAIQSLRGTEAHQLLEEAGSTDAAIAGWKQAIRRQLRRLAGEEGRGRRRS